MGRADEISDRIEWKGFPDWWDNVSCVDLTEADAYSSPISVRLMPLMKCRIHRLTVTLEGMSDFSDQ
jgi:hypothetical protein